MIPWLHRLPTPEEVAAHAKAYPILGGEYGLWLRALPQTREWVRPAALRHLLVIDDSVQGWGYGDHEPGACWLPCTAEGIPVCFLGIPWRTILTREEVAAHAAAHPVRQWFSATSHAYWLKWSPSDHIEPHLFLLGIVDGQLSWNGDKSDGMIEHCAACGELFLPCTAQGVPVDLIRGGT